MTTKGDKVFLLTIESSCDGAQNIETHVFANMGDAKSKLVQAYHDDLSDWKCGFANGKLGHCKERNNLSAQIYERGNFNYNHITYLVEALLVE